MAVLRLPGGHDYRVHSSDLEDAGCRPLALLPTEQAVEPALRRSSSVIASESEAIHRAVYGDMDCFVALLLAMTVACAEALYAATGLNVIRPGLPALR